MLLSWDLQRQVYAVDNTVEQVSIDLLGEGISGIYCTVFGNWLHHRLSC